MKQCCVQLFGAKTKFLSEFCVTAHYKVAHKEVEGKQ